MASPKLISKLQDFAGKIANKVSGTSVVDNGNNPNSAAGKIKSSIRSVPKQQAQDTYYRNSMKMKVFGEPE